MLLSKDEEVMELRLTPIERNGLDLAVAGLRRSLGPVDAYLAKYSTTNGMQGRRTIIFGTKAPGRDGCPFLSISRAEKRHVLRFTIGSKKDRKVLEAVVRGLSRTDSLDSLVFPLDTLSAESALFQVVMEQVSGKLRRYHPDLYSRRVNGKSRMPSAYREAETPGPQASALLHEMDKEGSETTRLRFMEARLGQGAFRREMLALWDHRCAVTGCAVLSLVRASHAQPWAHELAIEERLPGGKEARLDPHNGLPLVGTLDLLFDAGLMTFDDMGHAIFADNGVRKMLLSAGLIPKKVCLRARPKKRLRHYLAIHRNEVFKGKLPDGRAR